MHGSDLRLIDPRIPPSGMGLDPPLASGHMGDGRIPIPGDNHSVTTYGDRSPVRSEFARFRPPVGSLEEVTVQ